MHQLLYRDNISAFLLTSLYKLLGFIKTFTITSLCEFLIRWTRLSHELMGICVERVHSWVTPPSVVPGLTYRMDHLQQALTWIFTCYWITLKHVLIFSNIIKINQIKLALDRYRCNGTCKWSIAGLVWLVAFWVTESEHGEELSKTHRTH